MTGFGSGTMASVIAPVVAAAFVAFGMTGQTPTEKPAPGSVSGVVKVAGTGQPLAGVAVFTTSSSQVRTTTDGQGRYVLRGLDPGQYTVQAQGAVSATRSVTLSPGQDLTSVDFRLEAPGTIFGKVVDEDNSPVAGAEVTLAEKIYDAGTLSYVRRSSVRTDNRGEYQLKDVRPAHAYVVMARAASDTPASASDAPAEPGKRRPVIVPTAFPNSPTLEGAAAVVLLPGERREAVNVRLVRSLTYCVEGTAKVPGSTAELAVWFQELQPASAVPAGGAAVPPAVAYPNADGEFRICGLHSGEYALAAATRESPRRFDYATVIVGERDVSGVKLAAQPGIAIAGSMAWDGPAPAAPDKTRITVTLATQRLVSALYFASSPVPGEFRIADVARFDMECSIRGLPGGYYVKDITYGGVSVFGKRIPVGKAVGSAELRILVARDGGSLAFRVTDEEGKPVVGPYVTVFPADVSTEADLALALRSVETDQAGAGGISPLRPGKYLALASGMPFDQNAESVSRLWRARSSAKEIEISPSGGTLVTLKLANID